MRIFRRAAQAAAVLVGSGALIAAAAGAAGASVTPPPVGTTDGTAGYISTIFATNLTQTAVGAMTLTAQAKNIGTTTSLSAPNGALGIGMCNNANGKAAQVGALWNGTSFEIAYAVGTLKGNGADACVNDSILTDGALLHPLLNNLPVGTSVQLQIVEFARGVGIFAENLTTTQSFSAYVSFNTSVWVPGHWTNCHDGSNGIRVCTWKRGHWRTVNKHAYYNESQAGVQQNLALLGGPASNDLVDFLGVTVNGAPLGHGGDNAIPVDSSGTGSAPWLAGVADSTTTGPNGEPCPNLYGPLTTTVPNFSVCAATPVGMGTRH